MRPTVALGLFLFLTGPTGIADQTVSGDVWGTWFAGETITVIDDIRVPLGHSLIIEPGVMVLFTGRFKFTVEGLITAIGTADKMITFTRALPTEESKWRGFRFLRADDSSVLEYCHLEWAKGDGAYPDVRGGAVYIQGCSPTIRHCRFNDNYSHNEQFNGTGGAISMQEGCYSIVELNSMARNQADLGGAIFVHWECDPTIRYNLMENNEAFFCGGAVEIGANAKAMIYGNIVRDNKAVDFGGGLSLWSETIYYGTYAEVFNNVIVGNRVEGTGSYHDGGGIYCRYDTSRMSNNTIVGNYATRGGGLYVVTFATFPPVVVNSIVRDNVASAGPGIFAEPTTGSR
ncbi:MAG: right-handed parallel beta-helix repeat-containing protein, partial [Candidatus Zixiibacteriota bacterium]